MYASLLSCKYCFVDAAHFVLGAYLTWFWFETARRLGIELLFLPPYSPNLNLIERLWRFVRKECLYSTSYEHFDAFKHAITQCLVETTGHHQAALSRLLTLEFQIFESAGRDR